MAASTQIKKILKELNCTEEDMQKFWNECKEINWKIRSLDKYGQSWKDLPANLIMELPTLKEETLASLAQKQHEENEKRLEEERRIKEQEYYLEHFDEIMVNKIDAGEKLSEIELRKIVYECNEISKDYGENRRWTRSVQSIVELCNRYFCIQWEEGLTEYQDNSFYEQPYEVKRHDYTKTIIVTEWEKVKK